MAINKMAGKTAGDAGAGDEGVLARCAVAFTRWAEKWFPDAFVFVVLGVIIVAAGNLATGAPVGAVAAGVGDGFWSLIPFTIQMSMVVITGYVVASSPPVLRLIEWLARVPATGRGAVAFTAFVSMAASYLNYALSLVLGALLVRALARRQDIRVDYRAAGAAAYLGLGATWALGLSSSAAMLQANPASLPKAVADITGIIPLSQTIFLWQSMVMGLVILLVSVAIAYYSAPGDAQARTAADLGVDVTEAAAEKGGATRPGDWLELTPILPLVIVALGAGFLVHEFQNKPALGVISNLNTYNFFFIMLGLLLHGRLRSFLTAVSKAVPSTAGVLIQFPFYGAIAQLLTQVPGSDGQSISHHLAHLFVSLASGGTFPVVIGIYSAILGFLVPSGGGKWIIEAPYVMQAAIDVNAHKGWAVQVYNAAEALPNLINPFWMLPLLGVLGLKAKDIVGFSFTQLLFHLPLVLFLLWLLAPAA
ncbi:MULTISPECIES: short-chain fatty acid transporter [Nitrospirillum]|uniref:Short-chain fatty acids transporter n=1 Tax=Nitrospirillum amazonense TaxID=28077 RepID=A0A560FUZ8_9PROT|nr:TIGR00366 family protein [Nitrospirillum amazonense]MEC4593686.1 TIGR00366 family protein [Nitrospirillum amazonense]TWB25434.1 short-chain fatty acids transporter [Nitrospirillum amazonense]